MSSSFGLLTFPHYVVMPHAGTTLSMSDNSGHSTTDQPFDLSSGKSPSLQEGILIDPT